MATENEKDPDRTLGRSLLNSIVPLLFGLFGLSLILSGVTAKEPYPMHYKGVPYLEYPGEDILFGIIIIAISSIVWWKYSRRR